MIINQKDNIRQNKVPIGAYQRIARSRKDRRTTPAAQAHIRMSKSKETIDTTMTDTKDRFNQRNRTVDTMLSTRRTSTWAGTIEVRPPTATTVTIHISTTRPDTKKAAVANTIRIAKKSLMTTSNTLKMQIATEILDSSKSEAKVASKVFIRATISNIISQETAENLWAWTVVTITQHLQAISMSIMNTIISKFTNSNRIHPKPNGRVEVEQIHQTIDKAAATARTWTTMTEKCHLNQTNTSISQTSQGTEIYRTITDRKITPTVNINLSNIAMPTSIAIRWGSNQTQCSIDSRLIIMIKIMTILLIRATNFIEIMWHKLNIAAMENLDIIMLQEWSLNLKAEIMPWEKCTQTLILVKMDRAGTDQEARASTIFQKVKNPITTNNHRIIDSVQIKYEIKEESQLLTCLLTNL